MTAANPRFFRSRHTAETDTNRVTIMPAEAERRAGARLAVHVITKSLNVGELVNDKAAVQVAKGLRSSLDFDHPLTPPWRIHRPAISPTCPARHREDAA